MGSVNFQVGVIRGRITDHRHVPHGVPSFQKNVHRTQMVEGATAESARTVYGDGTGRY
jgi:hypothetical protein